jgi:hypothetical protein
MLRCGMARGGAHPAAPRLCHDATTCVATSGDTPMTADTPTTRPSTPRPSAAGLTATVLFAVAGLAVLALVSGLRTFGSDAALRSAALADAERGPATAPAVTVAAAAQR